MSSRRFWNQWMMLSTMHLLLGVMHLLMRIMQQTSDSLRQFQYWKGGQCLIVIDLLYSPHSIGVPTNGQQLSSTIGQPAGNRQATSAKCYTHHTRHSAGRSYGTKAPPEKNEGKTTHPYRIQHNILVLFQFSFIPNRRVITYIKNGSR